MPGIVGFTIGSSTDKEARQVLRKMQELITHRDFYVMDRLFSDGKVCATRSHINIIQKHPQPQHESGIYVWLDGEFYNQDAIIQGAELTANTDAALLLTIFKQNKDFSFLKQIDGIYSAVIYDSIQQKVHLITDRYGLRYIYWTLHKGCLVWGSEVKAILAFPGFKPDIDHHAVDEFFGIGHMLGDRTWFGGVELLSSGTVLTWDMRKQSLYKQRYWSWNEIKPMTGKIDESETVEELGRLFIDAVERRSREGERVGLQLSGGLDSRAILAAMPDRGSPIHAVTFGKEGCDDIRIAAMVATIKGAIHHTFEINKNNWLIGRLEGVWWTDGQMDLMHMHGIQTLEQRRILFDINLNGFLGDAILGGSYINDNKWSSSAEKYQNRGRRFINLGPQVGNVYVHFRIPFFDNKLMEFAASIPETLRVHSYIYNKMLLKTFPIFYTSIPWQKTGIPISWPDSVLKAVRLSKRVKSKLLDGMGRFGLNCSSKNTFTDYPNWIRDEPGCSFFKEVLFNQEAIYPEYISVKQVQNQLKRHLKGEDYADNLCRYLAFEIWLQQVFEGNYQMGSKHTAVELMH